MSIFRAIFFSAIFLTALGLAACGGGAPVHGTAKPLPKPHSTAIASVSYRDVQSLVAAMAVHGAVCGNVQFVSSTMPGGLSPHVGCDGASSGDTSVVLFTDHGSALTFARLQIQANSTLGPVAEVVGPDWVVNTVPAFARQVVRAVGGQVLTAVSTPATARPMTPDVAADHRLCKTFNANIGNGGESQIAQALLADSAVATPKLIHDITKALTANTLHSNLRAQLQVIADCALASGMGRKQAVTEQHAQSRDGAMAAKIVKRGARRRTDRAGPAAPRPATLARRLARQRAVRMILGGVEIYR
jgi:hypothetical protein